MKIKAEVLGAETIGDALRLKLQGQAEGAADWAPMLALTVEVPPREKNHRAYYVGRKVALTIEPL